MIIIFLKTNVKAGVALGFLGFLHNDRAMMIVGVIMMVIGAAVSTYLGLVLVQDYTAGNISPLDARPYPVYGIISPLLHAVSVHYYCNHRGGIICMGYSWNRTG